MRFFFISLLLFINVTVFAQLQPEVILTTGHNDMIVAMNVSPDGRFLASSSVDNQVKIWDIAMGMEFRVLSNASKRVEELLFAPNGIYLASTNYGDELIVWNVITGEIIYQGIASYGKGLSFSEDGSELFFIGEDSNIKVLNLETKTVKQLLKSDVYALNIVANPKENKIYLLNHLGEFRVVDMISGEVISVKQLIKEGSSLSSNSDITSDGRYIAYVFNDDKLRIFDTKNEKFSYESRTFQSKIRSIAFDKSRSILYFTSHDKEVRLFNYKTEKIIDQIKMTSQFNLKIITNYVAAYPSGEIIVLANFNEITLYDYKKRKIFKKLRPRVQKVFNMTYDPTGKYLAIATKKVELIIWDLELNKVVRTIPAFFPCQFSPDGKSIIAMSREINLALYNVTNGEQIKSFDTDYEILQSVAFSKDGKTLAGAGFQNKIKVWNVESTNRIAELEGHSAGILAIDFHPTKPWIVSGSLDETSRVWNYLSKKEIQKFEDQTISIHDVKFSPNGKQLATASWDNSIVLRTVETWQTENILKGHVNLVNTIDYSGDGTVLISGGANGKSKGKDNSVICWDATTGAKICQFKNHNSEIVKVLSDPKKNRFFSVSLDGAVNYSDYESQELLATYYAIDESDFMIYTPDNYYMASKKALEGIAFRIGDKLVPFEQFYIHLDRPDIVAERIGKSSDKLVELYRYLYKRRLKKLNLEERTLNLNLDFNLPKLKIETKVDLVTTNGLQKIWVSASDDKFAIERIDIYVNNVPIFGRDGLELTKKVKSIRKEIEIPLINGVNKIQISCMNSNGIESLYQRIEIIRNNDKEKHDLYMVSIGVSEYKDDRFNLTYPTKDATDMLDKFKESKHRYNEVHHKLLLNKDVTIENIKALEAFFLNCTYEDFVIIFIAGHGVLNADYDYFFGTYDMDFNAPDERGLPYEQLSSLLDKIKAYHKLLIMDTCHSGELDKDEVEQYNEPDIEQGNIEFRGAGINVREKEGVGFKNLIKYTEGLFADINKGSGATVIASAGGAEFAMESDEWKNGLFTSIFLEYLRIPTDSVVYLSDVTKNVHEKVYKMSKEKQIPSAREENINEDYIIFGK